MSTPKQKRIGDMNGPWAIGLKLALATYPVMMSGAIAWLIWATSSIYELRGAKAQTDDKVATLQEIRGDVKAIGKEVTDLRIQIALTSQSHPPGNE